jgi:hypothetical protein
LVEASPAKLKLTLHAAQLRVRDSLDHVFEVAIDTPQCSARANALSLHPAKLITARRIPSGDWIRSTTIAVDQIA